MIHTVFFSPTSTTEKVVTGLSKHLDFNYQIHNLTLEKNRNKDINLNQEDLLIIGMPVYAGRIPNLLLDQISRIKGQDTKVVTIVVYGNRDYDDALLELNDLMKEQGFNIIASAAFIGEHSYTSKLGTNRPDQEDLTCVKTFADHVKENFNKEDIVIEVKGNRPYRQGMGKGFGPVVANTCLKCGICAINCPTGALVYNNKITVKDDLCIRCHKCVRVCPVYAIDFDRNINEVRERLEKNFSERKSPDLYY